MRAGRSVDAAARRRLGRGLQDPVGIHDRRGLPQGRQSRTSRHDAIQAVQHHDCKAGISDREAVRTGHLRTQFRRSSTVTARHSELES